MTNPATVNAINATTPHAAGMGQFVFMLVLFVVIFYFLMWRPQSQRVKAQRDLLAGLTKGDEVVTTGGLVGKIKKVTDSMVILAMSEDVALRIQKQAISSVLPKGTLDDKQSG